MSSLAGFCQPDSQHPNGRQLEELSGDRPDFTENTATVPPGRFQLELGTTTARLSGSEYETAWPEALLRSGIADGSELRLGLPVRNAFEAGIKHRLVRDRAGLDLTLLGSALFPSMDRAEPEAALIWSYAVPEPYELAGQFAYGTFKTESDWRNAGQLTLAGARRLSESCGTFLEYSLEFSEDFAPVHFLHHGYTWQLASLLQVDVHAGVGLSASAPDFFLGFGLIARLNRESLFSVIPFRSR